MSAASDSSSSSSMLADLHHFARGRHTMIVVAGSLVLSYVEAKTFITTTQRRLYQL